MGSETESLTLKLGLSGLSEVSAGFRSLTALIGGFGESLALLAGLGGLEELTRGSINFAAQLEVVGKITGLTVEALSGLAYAGGQADVSLEGLQQAMRTYSKYLVESGQGTKDFKTGLLELSELFQKIPDGAAKSAMAVRLFGRAGQNMIPLLDKGPAALQGMFARGEFLTGISEGQAASAHQLVAAFDDLELAVKSLAFNVTADLLPAFTNIIREASDLIAHFRDWSKGSETFQSSLKGVGAGAGVLAAYLGGSAIAKGGKALYGTLTEIGGGITALLQKIGLIGPSTEGAGTALTGLATKANAALVFIGSAISITEATIEAFGMFSAKNTAAQLAQDVADSNFKLRDVLEQNVALREKDGRLSADAAKSLRDQLAAAKELAAVQQSSALHGIANQLSATNPKADAPLLLTKEQIEAENNLLKLLVEKSKLDREGFAAEDERRKLITGGSAMLQADALKDEAAAIGAIWKNSNDGFKSGALTQVEIDQAEIAYRTQSLNLQKQQEALQDKIRQQQLQHIQGSFALTDVQKYDQTKALLPPGQQSNLGPDPHSFSQQWTAAVVQLQNEWGTFAIQTASAFKNVFDSAISSISSGITGLIMGTKTWGQAIAQIGDQILTSIVSAIVEMGVRWVVTRIMMETFGKALQTASLAATAPIAAAQAAIWAPAATLSTIATFGASAAAAPGLIGISEGATAALPGFAEGGFTGLGGKLDFAGIVHKGEFVMPADAVSRIGLPALEGMRLGSEYVGPRNLPTQNNSQVQNKVTIAHFNTQSLAEQWARSNQGEVWFHDMMRKKSFLFQKG
jgi:hypothetical protein